MESAETANIIVVAGLVITAAATLLGAWLTHRKGPSATDDDPKPELGNVIKSRPEETVVHLHDADRAALIKLTDAIFRAVTRIEEALQKHRHAVEDNSDHLKRSKKD